MPLKVLFDIFETMPSFFTCFIIFSLPIASDNLIAATLEEIANALLIVYLSFVFIRKVFRAQLSFL